MKLEKFNPQNFYLVVLTLFPLCFILGSFSLNLIILIIAFYCFYDFKKINLINRAYLFIAALIIFILVNTYFSYNPIYSLSKGISYLRYIFFLLGLTIILSHIEFQKIKTLLKLYFLIISFIIFDIWFEFIIGKDIFGNNFGSSYNRISGPFGDELIVGFFLFYFSIVTYSIFIKFFKVKLIYHYFFFVLLIYTLYLTGERNAFFSSLIFVTILLFFVSGFRKIFFLVLLTIFIMFSLSNKYNVVGNKYELNSINIVNEKSFSNDKKKFLENYLKKSKFILSQNQWFKHYLSAYELFKTSPYLGTGFKTFRNVCLQNEMSKKHLCSSHPHNIYFEALSDLGLIGLMIFILIFFIPFKKIFIRKFTFDVSDKIILVLFFTYIFPFKPHGSLFTTTFATMLWFIYAFCISTFNKKKIL